MIKIGFLALAQAHQHLHWIPAALRLAAEPGVQVDVLCPSRSGLRFIRSFDQERRLRLRYLPCWWRDGLFDLPPRRLVLNLYAWLFRRYPVLVTTEVTSSLLKERPDFRSALVRIPHGAGEDELIYDERMERFDLTLLPGQRDLQRMIERGSSIAETSRVCGYAKFELVRPPPKLFGNDRPIALYNPHFKPEVSSWFALGPAIVAEMEQIRDWNFIVAPHVRLENGPRLSSGAPNVLIDYGSARSIDMTYTQSADVYVGDASSQLFEFLRRPRPCIFVDAHDTDWQSRKLFAHWALGQIIRDPSELRPALEQAPRLQPQVQSLQRRAVAEAIDEGGPPASERQARAILDFVGSSGL